MTIDKWRHHKKPVTRNSMEWFAGLSACTLASLKIKKPATCNQYYTMSVRKHIPALKYLLPLLAPAVFFFSITITASAADAPWGPWDKDRVYEKAIIQSEPHHNRQTVFDKLTTFPTQLLITFFQKVISPVDGPTCDFYPTCSAYARQALKKHGLFLGLTMANERANREHSPEGYELIFRYGRYYIYDPVENNDFWFLKGPNTAP